MVKKKYITNDKRKYNICETAPQTWKTNFALYGGVKWLQELFIRVTLYKILKKKLFHKIINECVRIVTTLTMLTARTDSRYSSTSIWPTLHRRQARWVNTDCAIPWWPTMCAHTFVTQLRDRHPGIGISTIIFSMSHTYRVDGVMARFSAPQKRIIINIRLLI